MSKLDAAVKGLAALPGGSMKNRLAHEIDYARRVSQALKGRHEALVLDAAKAFREAVARDGALTDAEARRIEESLLPMQADCKKYTLMLCGHAHIDMNWMWRYDETVQITLDTFYTVMDLMDEFPEFTFSQSQASVYRIVEEYDPELLKKIAARVKEGRWEVTASTVRRTATCLRPRPLRATSCIPGGTCPSCWTATRPCPIWTLSPTPSATTRIRRSC